MVVISSVVVFDTCECSGSVSRTMARFMEIDIVRISFSPVVATALEAIIEASRSISVLADNSGLDRDENWKGPVDSKLVTIFYGIVRKGSNRESTEETPSQRFSMLQARHVLFKTGRRSSICERCSRNLNASLKWCFGVYILPEIRDVVSEHLGSAPVFFSLLFQTSKSLFELVSKRLRASISKSLCASISKSLRSSVSKSFCPFSIKVCDTAHGHSYTFWIFAGI